MLPKNVKIDGSYTKYWKTPFIHGIWINTECKWVNKEIFVCLHSETLAEHNCLAHCKTGTNMIGDSYKLLLYYTDTAGMKVQPETVVTNMTMDKWRQRDKIAHLK